VPPGGWPLKAVEEGHGRTFVVGALCLSDHDAICTLHFGAETPELHHTEKMGKEKEKGCATLLCAIADKLAGVPIPLTPRKWVIKGACDRLEQKTLPE